MNGAEPIEIRIAVQDDSAPPASPGTHSDVDGSRNLLDYLPQGSSARVTEDGLRTGRKDSGHATGERVQLAAGDEVHARV